MFDDVPVRVWLLIAIAVFAFPHARYLHLHITHSPSRRDITQPVGDLSWRTPGQLTRALGFLGFLVGLAVFIFTPTAEDFARSPRFWPIVMAALGAFALVTVPIGFATGRIEPFIRGASKTYERYEHPKRFWASMAWNAALGSLLLWFGYQESEDAEVRALADACHYDGKPYSPLVIRTVCDELIGRRPNDADAYLSRGLIFLEGLAYDEAVADFTRAHELSPKDPWPLANRGLTFAWQTKESLAERDLKAARVIDPSNPVALRGEAVVRMKAGDAQGAVDRLTESMRRDPDNLWTLRTRAELNWEIGNFEESRLDDEKWRQQMKEAREPRN